MADEEQPFENPVLPDATKNSERLQEVLKSLSFEQINYCVVRVETRTDKDAAIAAHLTAATVKSWPNKALVDEAVRLMEYDGVITALELRRRSLAKAMAVKTAGLDSHNERIRQNVATEIIEAELGKAAVRNENLNIDLNNLTDEQLKQLGDGKDIFNVVRGG